MAAASHPPEPDASNPGCRNPSLEPMTYRGRPVPMAQPDRAVEAFEILLGVLEAQNPFFVGHAARVADLSATVAAVLGLGDATIEELRVAGRLHDLGKLAVPSTVLTARGPLTSEDAALVRMHPAIGAQILATIVSPSIQAAIRGHHERWDGTGYPAGLAGPLISLGARIVGAAEIFDALTSHRAHRAKMSEDVAIDRMQEMAGVALDPSVVDAIVTAVRHHQHLAFLHDDYSSGAEALTDDT